MFQIIWPERRMVSSAVIARWFADAVANDEIAPEYVHATTAVEMAHALSDAGIITLGR